MATLTISLSGSGIINGSKAYTISDADTQRLLNASSATFNTVGSNAAILLAYAGGLRTYTLNMIKSFEGAQVMNSASAQVAAIVPIVMS